MKLILFPTKHDHAAYLWFPGPSLFGSASSTDACSAWCGQVLPTATARTGRCLVVQSQCSYPQFHIIQNLSVQLAAHIFRAVSAKITQIALDQDPKVCPESCHWNSQNSVENTAGFGIPCHTCRFTRMYISVIRDVQEAPFFSHLGDDWCRPRRSCNDFS